jgi:hypothetical protein
MMPPDVIRPDALSTGEHSRSGFWLGPSYPDDLPGEGDTGLQAAPNSHRKPPALDPTSLARVIRVGPGWLAWP